MNLRVVLAVILFSAGAITQAQTPPRKIAVTFDDLPYAGVGRQDLLDARRVTKEILEVLKRRHIPAIGFVNEQQLQAPGEVESRTALLRDWVSAGAILGNHTYSHPDCNLLSIEQLEEEVRKGDVVTRQLMTRRKPYQLYFRFPHNHTGNTIDKKEALEKFLAERGYKIAPYTIENSDFMFTVVYVLAKRSNDEATAKRVRQEYLDYTIAATRFAEQISPRIFGREITQTLLVHANDLTADCLDEMIARLAARGYQFVSLDDAFSDPAYQTKDTLVTPAGPSWLWRWMKSKGMSISFAADPDPPQWINKSYGEWVASH